MGSIADRRCESCLCELWEEYNVHSNNNNTDSKWNNIAGKLCYINFVTFNCTPLRSISLQVTFLAAAPGILEEPSKQNYNNKQT